MRIGTSDGRRALDERAQRPPWAALSPMRAQLVLPVAAQLVVLALEAVEAQGVAQGEQQPVEAHRLLDEVEGARASWP